MADAMPEPAAPRWLLLIHQIPPKPDYFRVKVRRRLHRIGAVAIKSSVYVLPNRNDTYEDFQWLLREIVADGGDGSICQATFVDGLSDDEIIALFHADRTAAYAEIRDDAKALGVAAPSRRRATDDQRRQLEGELARLERRVSEVVALDFFDTPARRGAEEALARLERRLLPGPADLSPATTIPSPRGRTWVTREGIFVDRIASAWLIGEFIDRDARFKFVSAKGYRPQADELRFDMFEAEFTHVGDRCTFEVLLDRFGLGHDPALVAIGEVVHDIDLKDGRFDRRETPGVERLLAGIARSTNDDEIRRERGGALFTDLYASLEEATPGAAGGTTGQEQ
jgi:hypothetical protein